MEGYGLQRLEDEEIERLVLEGLERAKKTSGTLEDARRVTPEQMQKRMGGVCNGQR